MNPAKTKVSREVGARRCVNQLVKDHTNYFNYPASNDRYHRLVQAVHEKTALLSHRRLRGGEQVLSHESVLRALHQLSGYRREWVRSPETFVPSGTSSLHLQWAEFLGHIIEAYPTPRFFVFNWLHSEYCDRLRKLHFHIAGGGSLRHYVLPGGTLIDRTTANYLSRAPHDASVEQALRWAHVMAAYHQLNRDPDAQIARLMMKLAPFSSQVDHEVFWRGTSRFIARHELGSQEVVNLVLMATDVRFKPGNETFPNTALDHPLDSRLCIEGRTLPDVQNLVRNWKEIYLDIHRDKLVRRHRRFEPWGKLDIKDGHFGSHEESDFWEIVQLLTAHDLQLEGQNLKHCVGSYVRSCRSGNSSIWSMRRWCSGQMRRYLTIEVDPKEREIVEALGQCNRLPRTQEMAMVRSWAQEAQLKVASWVGPGD